MDTNLHRSCFYSYFVFKSLSVVQIYSGLLASLVARGTLLSLLFLLLWVLHLCKDSCRWKEVITTQKTHRCPQLWGDDSAQDSAADMHRDSEDEVMFCDLTQKQAERCSCYCKKKEEKEDRPLGLTWEGEGEGGRLSFWQNDHWRDKWQSVCDMVPLLKVQAN